MKPITQTILQQSPLIATLDNVLDEHYCQELINESESKTYEKAMITIGKNQYQANPNIRNNDRIIFEDERLANSLFKQVKPFLPQTIQLGLKEKLWELVGLNERFRYYRYSQGQQFKAHFDGEYERDKFNKSFLTLLFYLNEDFTGGATTFYQWQAGYIDRERPTHVITPKKGQALLFEHQQCHEGSAVMTGVKYVLRTDVMYRAVVA